MPDTLFPFAWPVVEGGYRWIRTTLIEQPSGARQLLVSDAIPLGAKYRRMYYSPLRDYPGLFRNFAEIDETQEAILQFANTFGLLGQPVLIDLEGNLVGAGELLALWRREIYSMREVVNIWMAAGSKNTKALSQRIRWEGEHEVTYRSPGRMTRIASKRIHPDRLKLFSPPDLIQPARIYVQETINRHLSKHTSCRLLRESDSTHLSLYFVPHNLLGALWLQFARMIDGKRKYRRCKACRRFIEISLDLTGKRADTKYCSDPCRQKAHRRRASRAYRR